MPHQVLVKLVDLFQTPFAGYVLTEHMLSSLRRYAFGFGLAALVGVPLGLRQMNRRMGLGGLRSV